MRILVLALSAFFALFLVVSAFSELSPESESRSITDPAAIIAKGTVVGCVTGDVGHLPWRQGKETLGWISVRAWQNRKLIAVTRTHTDGSFVLALSPGVYEIEITRPAFLPSEKKISVSKGKENTWDVYLIADPDFGLIVEPRAGMSRFCLPGEAFQVDCTAPHNARDWRVELFTDYMKIPLVVKQMVRQDSRPGWRLMAQVSSDTLPGLYHLRVSYRDANGIMHKSEQPGVVYLLKSYPERFRLLMHGDWHFNWFVDREGTAGEIQADYFRAATLLNALWISLGDDIGFEGDDHVAMFWHMLRHESRVPVFLAFGNHDAAITEEAHQFYFGPPVQARQVGPSIAIVRSFDLYQEDWFMPEQHIVQVTSAIAEAASQRQTRVVFLAGHQRRWRPSGTHFEMPSSLKSFLRLDGVRGPRTEAFEQLFLHSFSVISMHGWGGLPYTTRIVEVDLATRRVRVSPEIILPSVTYTPANNGTASTVSAVIRSLGAAEPAEEYEGVAEGFTQPPAVDEMKPYDDLTDLSLNFVMPRGRYKASHGRIIQQVDVDEITLIEWSGNAKSEETQVTIYPIDEAGR